MYKRIGAVALALSFAALAWFGSGSPSLIPFAFEDACADNRLSTLNVSVTPSQEIYVVGDLARFKIAVMRAVKADEHEEGHELGPAGAVEVKMALTVGTTTLSAEGLTDRAGIARLTVALPPQMPRGAADVVAFAEKEMVAHECVPRETGHFDAEDLVRIRR